MRKSPRIGLLLAPLATPVAYALWVVFVGEDPAHKDAQWMSESVMTWILILGVVSLFSYAASVLLGVPLIRVLQRLNLLSFWSVVTSAAFLGAVALVATMFSTGGYIVGPVWLPLAKLAGAGAFLGVLVAASYCWLAGIGRGGQ